MDRALHLVSLDRQVQIMVAPDLDNPVSIPDKFWLYILPRGDKRLLIVMRGKETRGSFEVASEQEELAWSKATENANSTLGL